MALADDSYATRRDISGREVDAWDSIAQDQRDSAINLALSRGGVTGQVGKTAQNIGNVAQKYAMDRALYEGDRARMDYDPYASERLVAYNTYADDLSGASRIFYDELGQAWDTFTGERLTAYDQRSDAYDQAAGAYYTRGNSAYDQFADTRTGASGRQQDTYSDALRDYYDNAATYFTNRQSGYGSSYDTHASGRNPAHGDSLDTP